MAPVTRWLYLPGLGTGTRSVKGDAIGQWLSARGEVLETVDLRQPDFSGMRLPAMLDAARGALGGPGDRAILIGTSLGGYIAARLAAEDPRVAALVLLAPALDLADTVDRQPWGRRVWEALGWIPWRDKTEGRLRPLGVALLHDLACAPVPEAPRAAPVLIVHGLADRRLDVEGSRRWAATRPGVRLVEVPDGHDLYASLPVLLAELEHFLAPFLRTGRSEGRDQQGSLFAPGVPRSPAP